MRRATLTALALFMPAVTLAAVPAHPGRAEPFPLADVRLLPGPFHDNMVRDQAYLLSLDPDRLLSRFRAECGLTPKAPTYGGWEGEGVAGQSLGHYLSACALMYAATGDGAFKSRVTHIVDELAECQAHVGTGFVAGIPDWRNAFGNLKARHGEMIGWVPWYTLHKTLAGLRDAHLYCDSDKAKDVLIRLADWVGVTVAPLTDSEMQRMLQMEQGGMAETLADVYALTGDAKYLALARRFTHHAVLDPLAAGTDRLTGLHANTQVPKLIGAERIYALTGDDYFGQAAAHFWDFVTTRRTFVTGGNGDFEHFFDPAHAGQHLSASTAETCNVYNMLKLTNGLFAQQPTDGRLADYAERALFNQILGSQDPRRGMFTYHQSLRPGGFKIYSDPTHAFWCCVGTGMENHARYGEQLYFHDHSATGTPVLYVNQFIASELSWPQHGLAIKQQTTYPAEPTVRLTFTAQHPTHVRVLLRVPGWVTAAPTVTVNGQPVAATVADGRIAVERTWASGDELAYTIPMAVRTEPLEGDPSMVALLYGPSVLAADLGTAGLDKVQFFEVGHNENKGGSYPAVPAPVLVGSAVELAANVEPVAGQSLTFRTKGNVCRPGDVTLRPYAATHFVRYTVYFHEFPTAADYDRHAAGLAAAAEAERKLAARTVDDVHPGEQQSEVNHGLASADSRTGPHRDKHWRDAVSNGFFQYTLKVPAGPAELACTYWGDDADRTFDLLVDGHRLATERLTGAHPGAFFDQVYPLPADLTAGKPSVVVRFVPADGSTAGGAFDLRVLRRE